MAKLVTRGQRTGLYVTDYRDLLRELRKIQPSLVSELRKDFVRIAKPVQSGVKNNIPNTPPTSGIHRRRPQSTISGFKPITMPGRLTWGSNSQNKNTPVRSVKIETPSLTKARKAMRKNPKGAASIARLRVDNAAVVMADMAGRTGKDINKKKIAGPYDYSRSKSGKRTHKINNQGVGMIAALSRNYGKASRFVWPAVEKSQNKTYQETRMVLRKAYDKINRRLSS